VISALTSSPLRLAAISLAEVILLYLLLTVFQAQGRQLRDSAQIWLPFLAFSAPAYLLITWRLAARPDSTLGLAFAAAVAVGAILLLAGLVIRLAAAEWGLLVVLLAIAQFNVTSLVAFAVFVPTQVTLASRSIALLKARGSFSGGLWVGAALALAYVALAFVAIRPIQRRARARRAETVYSDEKAQSHVLRVYRCLWRIAGHRASNGFPSSEGSLRALGSDCWDPTEAPGGATGSYYDFRYIPGPPAPDGRIRTFALMTRNRGFPARPIYLAEDGLMRRAQKGWASARSRYSDAVAAKFIPEFMASLDVYRTQHGAYPSRIVVPSGGAASARGEISLPQQLGVRSVTPGPDGASLLDLGTRTVTYVPHPSADGVVTRFTLSYPARYDSLRDLRSYFIDEEGRIHATGENRPATAADPIAPDNEWWNYVRRPPREL